MESEREVVTDHYESNPNCFIDKRLAKHGGLEEMRAPEDANNRLFGHSPARHLEIEIAER